MTRNATLTISLAVHAAAVGCAPAAPEEMEGAEAERWREVEALAAPPPECRASAALLLEAQTSAPASGTVVVDDDGRIAPIAYGSLDERSRAGLELLHRHRQSRGGAGGVPEGERLRPIPLLGLGRLAIASSEGEADLSRIEDAMALSRTLYRCGSLVHGMVGLILAEEVAAWARDRGVAPTEALRSLAPAREEMVSLLARDAVFTYESVEGELHSPRASTSLAERARWLAGGLLDVEGGLRELRTALGDRVYVAAQAPADLAAAERAMAAREDARTSGPLVRALVIDLTPMVSEAEESIEAYDRWLAGASY